MIRNTGAGSVDRWGRFDVPLRACDRTQMCHDESRSRFERINAGSATTAAAMVREVPTHMSSCNDSEAFRWWFARNRGWAVPVLVATLLAAGLSAGAHQWKLRSQHEAAREVAKLGGEVQFIGSAYHGADLRKLPNGDEVMAKLSVFDGLVSVDAEGSRVSDEGLRNIAGLRELRFLTLTDTQVTDSGLVHLRDLPSLEYLLLRRTRVTGDGLGHMSGLTGLKLLQLSGTRVTDEGLEHLRGMRALEWLSVADTGVTDVGLQTLQTLPALRYLHVRGSRVSEAGLTELRRVRPDITVNPTGDQGEDGCCN